MSSSYPAAQFYQGQSQREQAGLPYQQPSNGTNVGSTAYPTLQSHQPMQSQSYSQSQAPQSQHVPLGQPPEGYVLAYVPAHHVQGHSQIPPAPGYSPYAQQSSPAGAGSAGGYSIPPPSQQSNPQALQQQFSQMNLQPQHAPLAALSPPAYNDRRSSQGSLNANGYPDEKSYAKKSPQYSAPNYPPSGSSHPPSGSSARYPSPSAGPSYPPPATSSSASPFPGHSQEADPADVDTSEMSLKDKVRLGLKNHFRNPLDPPPEAFSREPAPGLPYHPFPPFTIVAKGEYIDGGFPPVYMGSELGPHDVSEADWTRFREDVAIMGRLTGKQQIVSGVAPITMHIGATGFLVTKLIQKGMKKTRLPPVLELIELWNSAFFERRRVRVTMVTADMVKEAREASGQGRHESHDSHGSHSYKDDFKARKDEIKAAYIAEHGSDKGWKKYKEKMEKQMEKDDKRYKKEHKKEREAEKEQRKKEKDEYKKPRLYVEAI